MIGHHPTCAEDLPPASLGVSPQDARTNTHGPRSQGHGQFETVLYKAMSACIMAIPRKGIAHSFAVSLVHCSAIVVLL